MKRLAALARQAGLIGLAGLLGMAVACTHEADAPAEQAALVRTVRAGTGTLTEWIRLYGRIVPPADQDATLAPQVAGTLVALAVREGQSVRTGAILARVEGASLDDTVLAAEAAERRARAEAAYRKSAAARTATLVEKGVASRQDAEADEAAAVSADAALAEASSALATARRRRGWAELRAPFDGVIVRVIRRPGDSVDGTPATPVVQMASATGAQVAAEATAESLSRIKPGQPAEIDTPGAQEAARGARGIATPGTAAPALSARVLRVARSVESATGSGEVRLSFDQAASEYPLGQGVGVRIAVASREGATIVPTSALRRGEGGSTEVVVVEHGKAVVRRVTTGISEEDHVEVTSGLTPGEQVVAEDPVGLADGMDLAERP